jgi:hypothetical protein
MHTLVLTWFPPFVQRRNIPNFVYEVSCLALLCFPAFSIRYDGPKRHPRRFLRHR